MSVRIFKINVRHLIQDEVAWVKRDSLIELNKSSALIVLPKMIDLNVPCDAVIIKSLKTEIQRQLVDERVRNTRNQIKNRCVNQNLKGG